MGLDALALYGAGGLVAAVLGSWLLRGIWRARGLYRIRRAGPRGLTASRHRLWRGVADVERLDLTIGPGGPDLLPAPPYTFLEEHASGSQPCCSVRDARGRRWRVKWGHEVRCESFAVRLVWSLGYFAEVTHFVPAGVIEHASDLQRVAACVQPDGAFVDARFELDDPLVRKLFEEHSWAWNDNPFVGSRELDGLKIIVMLLSNWDTKDRRDVARGSNTAIFEQPAGRWVREARYLITDWGGSMGKWGTTIVTRGRWDVDGFEAQTPQFVSGVRDRCLTFGYAGQRTADVAVGITVEHARWFHRIARRLTDEQLVAAMLASGADQAEAPRFARAIRDRIRQVGDAAAR
jgi:hypothetical protein